MFRLINLLYSRSKESFNRSSKVESNHLGTEGPHSRRRRSRSSVAATIRWGTFMIQLMVMLEDSKGLRRYHFRMSGG